MSRRRQHPWSSDGEALDIMPAQGAQPWTTRNSSVDEHFVRRGLVEKRKNEWKKVLSGSEGDIKTGELDNVEWFKQPSNRPYAKQEIVVEKTKPAPAKPTAATSVSIREMRLERLKGTQPAPDVKPKESVSIRELRAARLRGKQPPVVNTAKKEFYETPAHPAPTKQSGDIRGELVHAGKKKFAEESPVAARESQTKSVRELRAMRLARNREKVSTNKKKSTRGFRMPFKHNKKTKTEDKDPAAESFWNFGFLSLLFSPCCGEIDDSSMTEGGTSRSSSGDGYNYL